MVEVTAKTHVFAGNSCNVYELEGQFFVQFDSGDHIGTPMECKISPSQAARIELSYEEAGNVFKELDRNSFVKISHDEWVSKKQGTK